MVRFFSAKNQTHNSAISKQGSLCPRTEIRSLTYPAPCISFSRTRICPAMGVGMGVGRLVQKVTRQQKDFGFVD